MGRRIIALLMLVLTVAFAAVPSLAATNDSTSMPLDYSSVEGDFSAAKFDTKKYIDSLINPDANDIAFTTEYFAGEKNYLYVFMYIPEAIKKDYVYEMLVTQGHVVTFTLLKKYKDNLGTYESGYEGTCVAASEDKLFYKFKIDVTDLGYNLSHERVYSFVSFTTPWLGEVTRCTRSFSYSGSHQDGSITAFAVTDTVIDLTAYSNVYRTPTSNKGVNWHNDIFSVYFLVDKKYEKDYDYLSAIEYRHFEQMWNAIVTGDSTALYQMKNGADGSMEDLTFDKYYEDYPSIFIDVTRFWGVATLVAASKYNINGYTSPLIQAKGESKKDLGNIYFSSEWDKEDFFMDLPDSAEFFDYTDTGAPSEIYRDTIYFDETFEVSSFTGLDPAWYTKIAAWLLDYDDEYEVDGTFKPIVKVDDSFFEGYNTNPEKWYAEHLVNERKAKHFKEMYDANKDTHSMYLFRFAQRDYYAADCVIDTVGLDLPDENGFYAQGTSFNEFQIISLTYRKDNVDYVVPVKMDPINVNGGITGQLGNKFDKTFGADSDVGEKVLGVIKIIIAVALLIGLLFFIIQFVLPMFWAPKAYKVMTGEDPEKKIKEIEKSYEKEKKR